LYPMLLAPLSTLCKRCPRNAILRKRFCVFTIPDAIQPESRIGRMNY